VYLRSDGRWAAELTEGYDEHGRQKRPRVYGRTQAEAIAKLQELKARVAQGLPAKPARQTVGAFLNTWLETVCIANTREKTQRTYRDLIEDHIIPELGNFELSKLGPQHVQQLLNNLLKKPKSPKKKSQSGVSGEVRESTPEAVEFLSPNTVKHCRDVLRAALNVAMKWNLVTRNAAALTTIKPRKQKARFYDAEQARLFLQAIRGERLEPLFWLALCVGPREGELLGLQWADLDFEKETVTILRSLQRIKRRGEKTSRLELLPTKTEDSQRSINLPRIVIDKLRIHQARQDDERRFAGSEWRANGMVFTTGKGTPLEPRNMLREYYRLRDRAELPKIRFHDLRHSAATILKEAGVPDEVIQKLLGHASVRTTQEVYMHLTAGGEKRAAAKMDEIFGPVAVTVAAKTAAPEPIETPSC
jgi:integrase